MRAIGIRAAPKRVTYSVLEEDQDEVRVLDIDEVIVPRALRIPDQFRYLRTTFLDIIGEYAVTCAGLRLAEATADNRDSFRIGVEAVLQELLASSPVAKYFCGRIATIAGLIDDVQVTDMKPLAKGEKIFRNMESWQEMSLEQRESFLTGVAALSRGHNR